MARNKTKDSKSAAKKSREFNNPDRKTISNIAKNYSQNEKALVDQLYFTTSHGSTIGSFREDIWRQMFQQIVPKKFSVEQSVFIIDSKGHVSNEVDLAVFDETYTPYIFRYGRIKFIPIEAVAIVIECKSKSINKALLKHWVKSISVLETSPNSYVRLATQIAVGTKQQSSTQSQTRPLRILCCLNEGIQAKDFKEDEQFDIIVRAPSKEGGLCIEFDEKKNNLKDWYWALNHAEPKGKSKKNSSTPTESSSVPSHKNPGDDLEVVKCSSYYVTLQDQPTNLLTFNLLLNQILMLLNNPIPFPHISYAAMFNQFGKEKVIPNE